MVDSSYFDVAKLVFVFSCLYTGPVIAVASSHAIPRGMFQTCP